ncbi:DUF1565 domain-containing protein [candidate division WOR-3 bacterium]|nr:DUF1565 domain-containing protein [candidate division WOR-3 bacterium]
MERKRVVSAWIQLSVMTVVVVAFVFTGSAGATIIRVPDDYPEVQQAINEASSGDTVLVAAGKYAPSTNGESFPINMKNGVRLLGAGADVCTLDAECTNRVIYCHLIGATTTTIEGFTITNGYFTGSGAAICCDNYSSPNITKNVITGNNAPGEARGGGIFCRWYSSPTITNNIITGNNAGFCGGGIECYWYSSPIITNNTITGNNAGFCGGGIESYLYSSPIITNNIITGNSAGWGGGICCMYYSSATITYDNVWDNPGGNYSGCSPGTGCISEDPLFVDPTTGDYHLQQSSPCIDAGDNDALGLPELDFDGNPRILDGNGDGIAVVDMGPFEYKMPVIPVALVTGGGWIPENPPGPGNKKTFGFNVHSETGVVWGQLQFNDHGTKMKVHSDTINTLIVQPGDTIANFSGDCRVDGVSGYSLECEVMDSGEPGHGVDKFSIDIYDAVGNPYYSAGDFLGGGNIQIHEIEREENPLSTSHKPQLRIYPNPFTTSTTITLFITSIGHRAEGIELKIYDVSGRLVNELLLPTSYSPLTTEISWDGRDEKGKSVKTGVYFMLLKSGNFATVKKITLVR